MLRRRLGPFRAVGFIVVGLSEGLKVLLPTTPPSLPFSFLIETRELPLISSVLCPGPFLFLFSFVYFASCIAVNRASSFMLGAML